MLEKIFNSKIRAQILSLLFLKPKKKYYAQEVINELGTDSANTLRELQKLSDLKVLKIDQENEKKFYSLNRESEYFIGFKKIFSTYNKKSQGDEWFIIEEMPNYFYPQMAAAPWSLKFANETMQSFGIKSKFSKLAISYNENTGALYLIKNEFDSIAEELIETFIQNPESAEKYNTLIRQRNDEYFKGSEELEKLNLTTLTNEELSNTYKEYYHSIYEPLHILHWIQTCADFGENVFTRKLMNYLKTKIIHSKHSLGDVFAILTTPTEDSYSSKEYKDLLKILQQINSDSKIKKYFNNTETRIIMDNLHTVSPIINDLISNHTKRYGWLGYNTMGPGWGKDYFIDILASFVRQNANPKELLQRMKDEKEELISKQQKYINELEINDSFQGLFKVARDLVFTKGYRKEGMFYGFSIIENLYREIGRRFYLSLSQIRFMLPHEIPQLLEKNTFNAAELNERQKYSIHVSTGHYTDDQFLTGNKAKKFIDSLNITKEDISNIKMLNGDCASSGRVRGVAKIINIPDDMKKMEEGNVLISIATTPDLVPAIKKSAAIVTDVGGITCHAAIISRELNIPCVIGTKHATKILNDGDLIDVDASHGKVTIIKKAEKIKK